MRHMLRIFACALSGVVFVASSAFAQALAPQDKFTFRQEEPRTGSSIRQALITGNIPLDKPYGELTSEQQAIVRSQYNALHPLDEPPFPRKGLGPLFLTLQKGATAYRADGELLIHAAIDKDGKPTAVKLYKAANPEFAKFATSAVLLTDFKPGLCKGQPCATEFPVRLTFGPR